MNNFFILGLPRSRTAWFANLFTTDRTHCFHELFVVGEKFKDRFKSNKEYTGNADVNLMLYPEGFEDIPTVIINRPIKESINSVIKNFEIGNYPVYVKNGVIITNNFLQQIKLLPNVIIEDYHNLNIERIWNHCVPTIPIDKDRLKLLEKLRVTTMYNTIREARIGIEKEVMLCHG